MARSYATRLLQSYGITRPEDIDLEAIAFDQGAVVKYRALDGCEARIVGKGGRAIISIDPRAIPSRQRFSLAHELAHWLLDRGNVSFLCKKADIRETNEAPNSVETSANRLAADLLMPDYIFDPLCVKKPFTLNTVNDLAERFGTSRTATALRMVNSGRFLGMVACYSAEGRQWFQRGKDVPEQLWPVRELHEDSQAFELIYGADRATGPCKVGAEAWIDRFDAHQYTITEHAMKISDDSVLVLLWWQDERQIAALDDR
jgi:Zn-dependent peptidase ImmA (M78 family)